jgi:hydrogenase nickel incorporation protein HypA/HybF
MHELPVARSILEIVLRHAQANRVQKVEVIHLKIGALSDLEGEWLQSYFDHLAKGTPAEGATLEVSRSPLFLECDSCLSPFSLEREELDEVRCPECGSEDATVISGTGYTVESMEAKQ